ncbi:unnamed protein product [Onchocerca flexuosa]|uniref:Uncharacterized protein n=1 Tax=Onchocerca flexuosa TaxID=387005 RepID=A0A183HFK1_9BILA|nr:unnamed protein product [Onchocerca flexuosa]
MSAILTNSNLSSCFPYSRIFYNFGSNSPLSFTNPVQPIFSPQVANPTIVPTQVPVVASGQRATICETTSQSTIPTPVPNYATMDSFVPYSPPPSADKMRDQSVEKAPPLQQHTSIFDAFKIAGDKFDSQQQMLQKKSTSLSHNKSDGYFQTSFDTNLSKAGIHVAPPIERNPNALIYTPPNMISENNRRPATSSYPTDYVAPVKAAGDVSLSCFQLVQFLIKATYRLPAGVTRDGIQLRINHLGESMEAGQVTDRCIKKLNFVVDGKIKFS